MSTGVLYDVREERFCHFVATGIPPRVARTQAGYPKGTKWTLKRLMNEPRIKKRMDELLEGVAKRAQMSRAKILDDIAEEWRLARANKQHSAALKAAEMLGSELHGMFRKHVDLTTRDEFSGMSSEELRNFIFKQLKEMGLSLEDIPKFIDAKVIDSKIEQMQQIGHGTEGNQFATNQGSNNLEDVENQLTTNQNDDPGGAVEEADAD